MTEIDQDLFKEQNINANTRRRKLLPLWIKIFIWIFLITGALIPVAVLFIILDLPFDLAIYGLFTTHPQSLTGYIIILLFTIKGIAAFGLWTEKTWAVVIAMSDAFIGILICAIVMLLLPTMGNREFGFSFRLELIALIPYLLMMIKIKDEWVAIKPTL